MGINFNKIIENKNEQKFYEELSKRIISSLSVNGPMSFEDILRFIGGSDRRLVRLLNQMIDSKMIDFMNGYFCVNKQDNDLNDQNKYFRQYQCFFESILDKKLLHKFLQITKNRPKPTFLFDQRPITPKSSVLRAQYIHIRGDIIGKNIAVLGDDDLTSIALGLLGASLVTVFEIDQRLTKYISNIAKINNLPIKVFTVDLLEGIDEKHKNKFDVFITDPTPELSAFIVFLNSAKTIIKKEGVGYISIYPSHGDQLLDFQDILTRLNFIITDCIPYSTEYAPIEQTYQPADKLLFNRFNEGSPLFSFTESSLRIKLIGSPSKKINLNNNTSLNKIIGRATRRVIKNPSLDPAMNSYDKDNRYLLNELARIKKALQNQKKRSQIN